MLASIPVNRIIADAPVMMRLIRFEQVAKNMLRVIEP